MITIMKDQEWKDVRSSVTPAFTTGKIKRVRSCAKSRWNRLTYLLLDVGYDKALLRRSGG